ncbi:putative ribonuclease H-like domain-containing protein [Tanacetum coccineum]
MSIDDLYNNFKIVEQEVKRIETSSSNSNASSQNIAFVLSPSSTNEVNTANVQVSTANSPTADSLDNTANLSDATVYVFLANQPNRSQLVHEDIEQIHEDDLEEMDLKYQLALLSMRARRYFQRTGKKITINGSDTPGYDKSKVECFNYHKIGHFARECRGPRNQDNRNRNQDNSRRTVNVEENSSKAMVAIKELVLIGALWQMRKYLPTWLLWLSQTQRGLASVEEQLVFYKKNEVMFCDQIAVLKRDTSFKDSEINALKSEIEKLKKEKESNQIKIDKFENASKSLDKLIGSQISDNSIKGVGFVSYNAVPHPPTGLFAPPTIDLSNSGLEEFQQPEFEGYGPKASKSVCKDTSNEVKKTPNALLGKKLVLEKEKQTIFPTKIESVKQQEKPARKPVKNMTPRAVLMKNGLKPLNTARPVNTAHPKTTVYRARPMSCFSKLAQSTEKVYTAKPKAVNTAKPKAVNTIKPKVVNTARPTSAVVNAVRANQVNAVKASACWVWRPTKLNSASITFKRQNCIDARGRSKSVMAWTLRNLKEDMLPLGDEPEEEELLVHELLKLMYDKKNSVLFTDTACFVLSLNFKLLDESQVLLKVPRKNNMYSIDMKNIIPKKSLTCLVAKATLDESMLWHRRLGHINFKTINKLVRDNLVRGLPAKYFENDQTYVACLKGKQHKASCKSKIQNSITLPLFMLHMDLFGLTFMSNLMNKKYCLMVTDDYSRFTWVFFLASKDETSGILKNFITEIENLVDKKVKIIRCENETEFKNRVMNEFCEKKGIKREFSVARTPQQNGVAKRRNRTLIEAARTMLADSKLPTTC